MNTQALITATVVLASGCASPRADRLIAEGRLDSQHIAEARIRELGRALFFDATLSRDSSISCASCHDPLHGFAEPHRLSHGVGIHARRRNAQSVMDIADFSRFDWDGRAASLEDQAFGVFTQTGDMGIDIATAVDRLQRNTEYHDEFVRAFGHGPDATGLVRALAEFQRGLRTGPSRFDRFFFGGDSGALTPEEREGFDLFSSIGCQGCHPFYSQDGDGRLFSILSDMRFHNLGVGYANGWMSDVGRYAVTRQPRDWGAFRTPSLRNVALTAPYMHDGNLADLTEVVRFYAAGGIANPFLDPIIRARDLTDGQVNALVRFLHTLTSDALLDSEALARYWRLAPSR